MDQDKNIKKSAEEFLSMFKKGEEFTQQLLKENERLRFRIAEMEDKVERSSNIKTTEVAEQRIEQLESELSSLRERFKLVEDENKDFATKYVEVEEENNNLANLYVASHQLHSTLDFNEVLRIVLEIIINLIGAEKFAIYLIDEKTNELVPVAAEGTPLESLPRMQIGEGTMGKVARDGESYFAEITGTVSEGSLDMPIVAIPLKIKEHVIGVIPIYSLLVQKTKFTNVDHELFNLLAGHAATAVFSARLYTQSERKLTTIQGFLELLKDKPRK